MDVHKKPLNNPHKGYLYYLRLIIDNKKHYKIGFTSGNSVFKRFSYNNQLDYKHIDKIIFFHYFSNAYELEQNIHRFLSRMLRSEFFPEKDYPFFKNGQSEIYPEDVLSLDNSSLTKACQKSRDLYVNKWVGLLPLYSENFPYSPIEKFNNKPIIKLFVKFYRVLFGDPIARKRSRILAIHPNYFEDKKAYLYTINLIHGCIPFHEYDITNEPPSWILKPSQLEIIQKLRGFPHVNKGYSWREELYSWADELQIPEDKLPRNLSELNSLEVLNLDFETYNRTIYICEHITKLTNLKKLKLCGAKIVNLPLEIGNLKNLVELEIIGGRFYFLPDSICNLLNLKTLILVEGKLKALPKCIGKLKKLKSLDCSANDIDFLPSSIGDLQNLEDLGLGGYSIDGLLTTKSNLLTFLPKEFGKLNRLIRLEMGPGHYDRWHDLGYEVPKVIFKLNNLEFFRSGYLVEQSISKFKKMRKLKTLISHRRSYEL